MSLVNGGVSGRRAPGSSERPFRTPRLGFGRVAFAATRPGDLERSNGTDIAIRRHVRFWPSTAIYRPTIWVEDDLNFWQLLYYSAHPGWKVVSEEDLHPGATSDEYEEWGRSQMSSTLDVAKVFALGHLGLAAPQRGEGVVVVATVPGPADGVLHKGDVIVGINGMGIRTTDDLGIAISRAPDGGRVELAVQPVNPADSPYTNVNIQLSHGAPRLGAILRTHRRSFDFPVDIEIPVEGAGASGSLAIALGILDVLTERDLASVPVAVTGVLHPDGSVGAVTGVRQKALSLYDTEVRRMLVPVGQGSEARAAGVKGLEVCEVANFHDSLAAIGATGSAPQGAPAPLLSSGASS